MNRTLRMNFLFLHNNFPGQFHRLSVALAANSANKVLFLSRSCRPDVNVPGVQWEKIRTPKNDTAPTDGMDQPSPLVLGELFGDAMRDLQKKGFTPDVVYGHAGFGTMLHAPDIFLDAAHVGYFEWMYTREADTAFAGGRDKLSMQTRMQHRLRNLCVLSALETSCIGISPTLWQRDQHPPQYYSKMRVLHDGVDTNYFTPADNSALKIEGLDLKGAEIITYATRGLEPYRGFHTFYRSLPAVLKARPKAQVLIMANDRTVYGGKPRDGKTWREVLQDTVDVDEKRVHFLPFQPYPRYRALLRASHVHVYLTVPFVLSWSLLEAMSCGCLVIGSDTEPVREVLQHERNGLLTQFWDHEMLSRRIIQALKEQKNLRHLRKAARETVLQRYDLMNMLRQQIRLLEGHSSLRGLHGLR